MSQATTSKTIILHWTDVEKDESLWDKKNVLFAFIHPTLKAHKILYIGTSMSRTVAGIFLSEEMNPFWEKLEKEYGLTEEQLKVIVGVPKLPGGRLGATTRVDDITAFIVQAEYEGHNLWWDSRVQDRSRLPEGMTIKCTGEWEGEYNEYEDG